MTHPMRDPKYDRANFIRIAPDVELATDVRIFSFVNLYGCKIGHGTQVGAFVEIQRGARRRPALQDLEPHLHLRGVTIEDECFIGHGVMFINDRRPSAVNPDGTLQGRDDWTCEPTRIRRRASIGSGSVILCGVTFGEGALVGAGAVVTKDVPSGVTVLGVPARMDCSERSAEPQ